MPPNSFQRIHDVVSQVPSGRVVTYGQIARHLGMPSGARTVGWAMHECPTGVPWHRVLNTQGRTSLRGHGAELQRTLLEDEGVQFGLSDRVDLRVYGWDGI